MPNTPVERLLTPTDAVLEAATAALEQAIIESAARSGIDLRDPELAIFDEQRRDYRRWMMAVPPVAARAAMEDGGVGDTK